MSGDVTGTGMGTRPITIAESVSKAIAGKPKGLLDDMARAARTHEERQLAALGKKKPGPKTSKAISDAKKRGQRRFEAAPGRGVDCHSDRSRRVQPIHWSIDQTPRSYRPAEN